MRILLSINLIAKAECPSHLILPTSDFTLSSENTLDIEHTQLRAQFFLIPTATIIRFIHAYALASPKGG